MAYLALGVLAFTTLSDQRIRSVTLLILGLFAFKTWVRRNDVLHLESESKTGPGVTAENHSAAADGELEPRVAVK